MPRRVTKAKIACLDMNLQKARMMMGVQVLVNDPKELEKVRGRVMRVQHTRAHGGFAWVCAHARGRETCMLPSANGYWLCNHPRSCSARASTAVFTGAQCKRPWL